MPKYELALIALDQVKDQWILNMSGYCSAGYFGNFTNTYTWPGFEAHLEINNISLSSIDRKSYITGFTYLIIEDSTDPTTNYGKYFNAKYTSYTCTGETRQSLRIETYGGTPVAGKTYNFRFYVGKFLLEFDKTDPIYMNKT